ncbi:MAG: hypothetical protein PVG91_03480 [Gammaproteobacteria bacterium]|jgi:hypothetical protein
MKRPTFLHGVGLALALAVTGAAAFAAIAAWSPLAVDAALRGVIAVVGLAYVVYLLASSGNRIGRVTTLAIWLAVASATWWLAPAMPVFLLVHALMIWLVRVLYFHDRALPALTDLGLGLVAVAAAVWAVAGSGSLFLALWSYFLIQALFVLIPGSRASGRKRDPAIPADAGFERAHRSAESALRRLATRI